MVLHARSKRGQGSMRGVAWAFGMAWPEAMVSVHWLGFPWFAQGGTRGQGCDKLGRISLLNIVFFI